MTQSASKGFPTRILLTGGAGFIGSHVAEALLARGAHLTIVDHLDPAHSRESKRVNLQDVRRAADFAFHEADVCDLDALRKTFEASNPQAVIHLAAKTGVRASFVDSLAFGYVNVTGTFHVLELCREFRVERIVLGSSSSVYGVSPVLFSEDLRDLRPISPYAVTKLEAESLARDFAHTYGLRILCLRLFSVYGPRQRPDAAIHNFSRALDSGEALTVFGDGSSQRDFTWVGDIAAGILAALELHTGIESSASNGSGSSNGGSISSEHSPSDFSSEPFEVLNLGSSHAVSINELISLLEQTMGRRAQIRHVAAQPGDVPFSRADIAKARRLLGFQPRISLEEGLARFVDRRRSVPVRAGSALARGFAV